MAVMWLQCVCCVTSSSLRKPWTTACLCQVLFTSVKLCVEVGAESFVEMVFNEAYLHTRGWHFAQHSQSEYIPMSVEQPSLLSPPLFHSLCGWDTLKKKKKENPTCTTFLPLKLCSRFMDPAPWVWNKRVALYVFQSLLWILALYRIWSRMAN